MEQGRTPQAERDLTLAIKLADNPAGPSKQRAGCFMRPRGRWADARRDFETMVKYAPENPEAWFFRAQSQLALGDATAAARTCSRRRRLPRLAGSRGRMWRGSLRDWRRRGKSSSRTRERLATPVNRRSYGQIEHAAGAKKSPPGEGRR